MGRTPTSIGVRDARTGRELFGHEDDTGLSFKMKVAMPLGNDLPTVAVILAGGTGRRLGMPLPKQLVKVAGQTVIEHTLSVFDGCDAIDEIYVLMARGYVEELNQIISQRNYHKIKQVAEGGSTRSATTRIALGLLGERECNVLLHDAVRPLVDHRILNDCADALRRFEAIDVGIPSADTIIAVTGDGYDETIEEIPDRSRLRRGQTPQGFRLSVLKRAYERATDDPEFTATDDCGVVRRYLPEVPIHVVAGSERNMKITHPIDVYLTDRLFQLAADSPPRPTASSEIRSALTEKTVVVFGGGYGIGAELGKLVDEYGARVFTFSRSTTGTYVERPEQVSVALQHAYDATGRIDYVVNTAGQLHTAPLAECDEDILEHAMRVNYLAPMNIARLSLPYLVKTRGGLLLYTSSSYTRGRAGYSLYSSAKAAIVNLVQALADEWSSAGVRVNCVSPERTDTPMRRNAFGIEPAESLLSAHAVARRSLDVLISEFTGHVVDVRRSSIDPFSNLHALREGDVERE